MRRMPFETLREHVRRGRRIDVDMRLNDSVPFVLNLNVWRQLSLT